MGGRVCLDRQGGRAALHCDLERLRSGDDQLARTHGDDRDAARRRHDRRDHVADRRTTVVGELDPADPTFEPGFASGVSMPVVFAGRTVGVVQLFSRDVQPRDEDYLQILYSTNVQIEQALQRRQIEKDLATAERKYREIVEQSVQGIYQTAEDGRFLSANAAFARMMGFGAVTELLDAGAGRGRVPVRRRGEARRVPPADSGQRPGHRLRVQMRRRDGDLIWISENSRVVVDRASGRSYCEGFVEDITERKQPTGSSPTSSVSRRTSCARRSPASAGCSSSRKTRPKVPSPRVSRTRATRRSA